ncbi:hypothetical protein ACTGVD_11225, partial [Streptococcus suis]
NAPIANGHFQTSNGPVATTLHEAHVWVADANGLFHTATDLNAEWHKIYQTMLNGEAGRLTPVQRLEGNAEAVFENTNINNLDAATQEKYREDA